MTAPRTRRPFRHPAPSFTLAAGTLIAAWAVSASGLAAAQAPMPAPAASATPAQKKPAQPGAQGGAASAPATGTDAVGDKDVRSMPAEKRPAKAGAQSGAASAPR